MTTNGCDYQGYEFGACYLDSVCINGYLWDADSGEPGEALEVGGEIPCPMCNHDEFLEYHEEQLIEQGYAAFMEGIDRGKCPYPPDTGKEHKLGDFAVFRFLWLKGYGDAVLDKRSGSNGDTDQ